MFISLPPVHSFVRVFVETPGSATRIYAWTLSLPLPLPSLPLGFFFFFSRGRSACLYCNLSYLHCNRDIILFIFVAVVYPCTVPYLRVNTRRHHRLDVELRVNVYSFCPPLHPLLCIALVHDCNKNSRHVPAGDGGGGGGNCNYRGRCKICLLVEVVCVPTKNATKVVAFLLRSHVAFSRSVRVVGLHPSPRPLHLPPTPIPHFLPQPQS